MMSLDPPPDQLELDVRSDLKNGKDPFEKIMGVVKELKESQTLTLHTTFRPLPLIRLMKMQGFTAHSQSITPDHWVTTFLHDPSPQPATDPSEPSGTKPSSSEETPVTLRNEGTACHSVAEILHILENAGVGETVTLRIQHFPDSLRQVLERLLISVEAEQEAEGFLQLKLRKKELAHQSSQ